MRNQHKNGWRIWAVNIALAATAISLTMATTSGRQAEHKTETASEQIEAYNQPTAGASTQLQTFIAQNTEADNTPEPDIVPARKPKAQETAWTLSKTDKKILKKIAMAEAEGESTEGKALVMLTALNRREDDEFPDTIKEVVFQKNQFSTTFEGGRYWTTEPDKDCEAALEMVMDGWDESRGALYFESCRGTSWHEQHLQYLYTVGGHRFYK